MLGEIVLIPKSKVKSGGYQHKDDILHCTTGMT